MNNYTYTHIAKPVEVINMAMPTFAFPDPPEMPQFPAALALTGYWVRLRNGRVAKVTKVTVYSIDDVWSVNITSKGVNGFNITTRMRWQNFLYQIDEVSWQEI